MIMKKIVNPRSTSIEVIRLSILLFFYQYNKIVSMVALLLGRYSDVCSFVKCVAIYFYS